MKGSGLILFTQEVRNGILFLISSTDCNRVDSAVKLLGLNQYLSL